MNCWSQLFRKPAEFSDAFAVQWFARIADRFLNRSLWIIASQPHRITEVEFYYRGPEHDDPYAHADPIEAEPGRWYFHKTGGVYRGGTFKGMDITFGDGEARAGVLIRGIQTSETHFVDGPSLIVDRALELCGERTVADLDQAISGRRAWDKTSPIHLIDSPELGKEIIQCARVGLFLRKAKSGSTKPAFLTRPYRFLTEPARIRKGKVEMVLALLRAGRSINEIRHTTRCPSRTIAIYFEEYETGRREGEFEEFFGKDLGPKDICRLHGIADRHRN